MSRDTILLIILFLAPVGVRRKWGHGRDCFFSLNCGEYGKKKYGKDVGSMRNTNLLRSLMLAFALATAFPGCAAISGRETPGEYVDDATITTKVKTAIISDLGLKQIGVETMQNVVQLSGFVDSQQIKAKAGEIARGISGVKEVKNNLVVR